MNLDTLCWPVSSLKSGLESLAEYCRFPCNPTGFDRTPPESGNQEELSHWLRSTGAFIGIDVNPITARLCDIEPLVGKSGPAIVAIEPMKRFLLIIGCRRNRVSILAPDLSVSRVDKRKLTEEVFFAFAADVSPEVEYVLDATGLSAAQRDRARKELTIELETGAPRFAGWLLDVPTNTGVFTQARNLHIPKRIALTLMSHLGVYLLVVAGWWLLGSRALDGQLDTGLLAGWALLLFSLVPLQVYGTWARGQLAIRVGTLLKQLLHSGALNLDLDATKRQGAGMLIGRVIESAIVDSLSVNGGLTSAFAILQLAVAFSVLWFGAAGPALAGILVAVIATCIALAYVHYRKKKRWVEQRLTITHDLVEKMVGYRTRLMQLPPDRWHEDDDDLLKSYYEKSRSLDLSVVSIELIPRAWLLISISAIGTVLLLESATIGSIAIAVGGSLLAFQALEAFVGGLASNVSALLALKKVSYIYKAARSGEKPGCFATATPDGKDTQSRGPLIDLRNVTFSHAGRVRDAIKNASIYVRRGDKIVIEGPSGSGKSTLAGLMAGLYHPRDGLILLDGMDFPSLGAKQWRKRITLVPQYHENYVVADTLAFNLFMGTRWPPDAPQLEEAWEICEELGLGELLRRMPAGLMQIVGETGWRLSHGERSRIYVARALLQHPQLLIIDESFGTLDPENHDRVMKCVVKRASTLILISHP